MPFSNPLFDSKITAFLKRKKLRTYLDVGAGAGKYEKLIHDVNSKAIVECVEPDWTYRLRFHLRSKYAKVHASTIQMFMEKNLDRVFDCVIFGDVLEHLKKSDGLDAINFFMYRSKYIILSYPFDCLQYTWEGHRLENHVSVWGKSDFANFEYQYFEKEVMRLVIIEGFIK